MVLATDCGSRKIRTPLAVMSSSSSPSIFPQLISYLPCRRKSTRSYRKGVAMKYASSQKMATGECISTVTFTLCRGSMLTSEEVSLKQFPVQWIPPPPGRREPMYSGTKLHSGPGSVSWCRSRPLCRLVHVPLLKESLLKESLSSTNFFISSSMDSRAEDNPCSRLGFFASLAITADFALAIPCIFIYTFAFMSCRLSSLPGRTA
mmetsp:Transcript_35244/g.110110  ORF Transcript_35244/g.110110 Transcript_35244/m.110110 type:complete len:205 (-) Transcript_35244:111-725(-)